MSDNSQITLESLDERILKLTSLFERQSQLIGKTGQQLMEMQVKEVKTRMSNFDDKAASSNIVDMDDYVSNEDIIQLVGELQSQLDFLEDRSIKRTFNAQLTEDDKHSIIAPVTNKDGELPPEDIFPAKVSEILELDKFQIVQLGEFYELVAASNEQEESQSFLNNNDEQLNLEDARKLLFGDSKTGTTLEERVNSYNQQQIDQLFDEITRFIGLRIRRNKNTW